MWKNSKYAYFMFCLMLLSFPVKAFTPGTNGYAVPNGYDQDLNVSFSCHHINRTAAKTIWVPFKTAGEWNSFISHPPSSTAVTACKWTINPVANFGSDQDASGLYPDYNAAPCLSTSTVTMSGITQAITLDLSGYVDDPRLSPDPWGHLYYSINGAANVETSPTLAANGDGTFDATITVNPNDTLKLTYCGDTYSYHDFGADMYTTIGTMTLDISNNTANDFLTEVNYTIDANGCANFCN